MPNTAFEATRTAGLSRLAQFAPTAGEAYASNRNMDGGPDASCAVSNLSPYLRYRLLTEFEVVAAVLDRHRLAAAEKFIQEVLWRTYWKGWLELRPFVWTRFLEERDVQRSVVDARALAAAESGSTGIEGFDDWARELVATGYLHNHARMWFASIWVFTLRLPWSLGADFFLRHLLDADAASNTLSWRWVAGLQTVGKHYLATAENIARYTNGRFSPNGLALDAVALTEPPLEAARALPVLRPADPNAPTLLLVTHDDLHPESLFTSDLPLRATLVATDHALLWGDGARVFVRAAARDTASRVKAHFGQPTNVCHSLDAQTLIAAVRDAGVQQIVTAYAPVGPVAEALSRVKPLLAREGITLAQTKRPWDELFWKHASKGYFPFRKRIPASLRAVGLA